MASPAQLDGSPRRRLYRGRKLARAVTVDDLRAMAHARLPRFVLEYLEGGAEEEASLARDRDAYGDWRFVPKQLVDVSQRSLAAPILGREATMPLIVAPTGLNGLFLHAGDIALAQAAANSGIPFVQSTMSNSRMEDVARLDACVTGGNSMYSAPTRCGRNSCTAPTRAAAKPWC